MLRTSQQKLPADKQTATDGGQRGDDVDSHQKQLLLTTTFIIFLACA